MNNKLRMKLKLNLKFANKHIRGTKLHELILTNKSFDEIYEYIDREIKKTNRDKKSKYKLDIYHYIFADNQLMFRCGCKIGNERLVLYTLEQGSNPAILNNQGLIEACKHGHTNIVNILLKTNKVNVAEQCNLPIRIAHKHGYKNIQMLLESYGAQNNKCKLFSIENELKSNELSQKLARLEQEKQQRIHDYVITHQLHI